MKVYKHDAARFAEQKNKNFRRWKSGKNWVYAAATLTAILGTGLVTATIKPQMADAATTNSTVSSESQAVASNSAAYSTAVSNASAVNSQNSVVTSDAKSVNTTLSDLTSVVNDSGLLSTSGASVYQSLVNSTSNVLTSQISVHADSNSDYQSLVNAYNSDLSAYQTSGSQVNPINLASYSQAIQSLLDSSASAQSTLGSLSNAISTAVSNNILNGGNSLSVNTSANQSAYHVASNLYGSANSLYTAESSAMSQLKSDATNLSTAISAYNSVTATSGVTQSQLDSAAVIVSGLQSSLDSQVSVVSAIHTQNSTVLIQYQSALNSYLSINEGSGIQSDSALGDGAAFESAWNSYTLLEQLIATSNAAVIGTNHVTAQANTVVETARKAIEDQAVNVTNDAAVYQNIINSLQALEISNPANSLGISAGLSNAYSALAVYNAGVSAYSNAALLFNSQITSYNNSLSTSFSTFSDGSFYTSVASFDVSANSELSSNASNAVNYGSAVSAAAVVSAEASAVNRQQQLVSADMAALTTLVSQNTTGFTTSQWTSYNNAITSAENKAISDQANYLSAFNLYNPAVSDYNSLLGTYQVASGLSQVPNINITSVSAEIASYQAAFNSYTSALTSDASQNAKEASLAAIAQSVHDVTTSAYQSESLAAQSLVSMANQIQSAVANYNYDVTNAKNVLNGTNVNQAQADAVNSALKSDALILSTLNSQQLSEEAIFSGYHSAYKSDLVNYQSALDAYVSSNEIATGVSDLAGGDDAQVESVYATYLSMAEAARSAANAVTSDNALRVQDYITANASRNQVENDIIAVQREQSAIAVANSVYGSLAADSTVSMSLLNSAYQIISAGQVSYQSEVNTYLADASTYQADLQSFAIANGMSASDAANLTALNPSDLAIFNSEIAAYNSNMSTFSSDFASTSAYYSTRDYQLSHQPAFASDATATDGTQPLQPPTLGKANVMINVLLFPTNDVALLTNPNTELFTQTAAIGGTVTSTQNYLPTQLSRPMSAAEQASLLTSAPLFANNPITLADGKTIDPSFLNGQTTILPQFKAPDGTTYVLSALISSYAQGAMHPTNLNQYHFLNPADPIKDFLSLQLYWSTHNTTNQDYWFVYTALPNPPVPPAPPVPVPLDIPKIELAPTYTVVPPTPKTPNMATPSAQVPLPPVVSVPTVPDAQAPSAELLVNYTPAPAPTYPLLQENSYQALNTINPNEPIDPIPPATAPQPYQAFILVDGLQIPTPPGVALNPTPPTSTPTKDVTKTDNGDSIDDSNPGLTGNTENTTNDPNIGDIGLSSNFVYQLNSRTIWSGTAPLVNWSLTDKFDAANDQYLGTFKVYQTTNGVLNTVAVDNTNNQYFTQVYDNAAGSLKYTATQAWLDKVNAATKTQDVSWRIDADFERITSSTDVQNSFTETVNDSTEESNTVNTHTDKPQPHKFDLNDGTANLTNNDLLNDDTDIASGYLPGMVKEPDGTFTLIVDGTANNPYVDGKGNNSAVNINTDTMNRGDHINYQLWLDTTPYDNTSLLTSIGMTDNFDATRLDANASDVRVYDVAGNDVTKYFTATISNGTLKVTANISSTQENGLVNPVAGNAGIMTQNSKGESEAILNTTLVPLGNYYKISFPTTIKAEAPAGDIVNVASQNVVDNNGSSYSENTETRVNNVPPLTPSIDIEKTTGPVIGHGNGNGGDTANNVPNDHDTPSTADEIKGGATTEIGFKITNNGTEDLIDLTPTDSKTSDNTDPASIGVITWSDSSGKTLSVTNGILTNADGTGFRLKVGDFITGKATLSALTPGDLSGDDVTINAIGAISGKPVHDDDKWYGKTPKPVIKDDKTTLSNGNEADNTSTEEHLDANATTQIKLSFTNSGEEPLTHVTGVDVTTSGLPLTFNNDWKVDGVASVYLNPSNHVFYTDAAYTTEMVLAVGSTVSGTATLPAQGYNVTSSDHFDVTAIGTISGLPVNATNPWNGITPPPPTTPPVVPPVTPPVTPPTTTTPPTTPPSPPVVVPEKPTPPTPTQPVLPDTGDDASASLILGGMVTIGAAGVVLLADRKKRKYQLFQMAQNATYKEK